MEFHLKNQWFSRSGEREKMAKIDNGEQEPHSTSESKENNSPNWKDFQESGTLTSDRFNYEE